MWGEARVEVDLKREQPKNTKKKKEKERTGSKQKNQQKTLGRIGHEKIRKNREEREIGDVLEKDRENGSDDPIAKKAAKGGKKSLKQELFFPLRKKKTAWARLGNTVGGKKKGVGVTREEEWGNVEWV